jgi:putative ABC transport system substrate-binding protein
MNRREVIAGLGSAAAWPLVAGAQKAERVRRIGVLMGFDENDSEGRASFSAFTHGLLELGWEHRRNVLIDTRWEGESVDRMRMFAKELVDLKPDVILSNQTRETAAFQRETQTIPIIFVAVSDPVGSGFATGLPRPGGNLTGFMVTDGSMGGKWLELLTEVAPGIKRAAAMFNPETAPYVRSFYLPSFEAAARSLKVEPIVAPVRSVADIEMVIAALGREPGGALVNMSDGFLLANRASTISLAAKYKVPTTYPIRRFARDGGLLSYGPEQEDLFRRAASYVDRILRGAKPAELPVQLPAKFQMALNAKAANALGLTVPQSILLRADEVIE